ncbi:MAG: type IV toxin-antitoxin system AbiEi family antitoxin [Pseudomonadota bacterium]
MNVAAVAVSRNVCFYISMRSAPLTATLRDLGRRGQWCFSDATLRAFYPEKANTFRIAVARHVRRGLLDRVVPGLYLNPYVPPPPGALERIVSRLRPWDAFYVSLESALHEHGRISQVPSRLTVMTSGRSHVFETPLGTIELVHTSVPPQVWRPRTTFIPERRIHVANAELALEDLRRLGRNLDLVDDTEE